MTACMRRIFRMRQQHWRRRSTRATGCPVCGNIFQELAQTRLAPEVTREQVERAKEEWESGKQEENDAKTALAVLGNRREFLLEQKEMRNRRILERNKGIPFREEDLQEAEGHVAFASALEQRAAELEKELEKRNQAAGNWKRGFPKGERHTT